MGQARRAALDNLAEARRLVAALAPPALDDTTLADALERLCATTTDRHRIDVRFRLTGRPRQLATAQEVALLRVAQSALANTVGHARAGHAEVALAYLDDSVTLGVTDDGVGFDPGAASARGPDAGGFGLPAMRARVHALDGTLTVESAGDTAPRSPHGSRSRPRPSPSPSPVPGRSSTPPSPSPVPGRSPTPPAPSRPEPDPHDPKAQP